MTKYRVVAFLFSLFFVISCSKENDTNAGLDNTVIPPVVVPVDEFIRAADLSFLPEAEKAKVVYTHNGVAENPLITLKNAGCNTVRLRIWHTPANEHSGLAEVKALSKRIQDLGMKVWLTIHYSDSWADPGKQVKPKAWNSLSFTDLQKEMNSYTINLMKEINPDIIQIGNEINSGFLFPEGNLLSNESQFINLLKGASEVIRKENPKTKIMIHFAGLSGADWFFNKTKSLDFDYIGISYYPIWHGKSIENLKNTINTLGQTYKKKIVIAETAYPFTLGWNDWTNNNVGLAEHLIPDYPATPEGQKQFLTAIKKTISESEYGLGFAYWGAEWVAFYGDKATNGSSWENQALWDFENKSLPVIEVFKP